MISWYGDCSRCNTRSTRNESPAPGQVSDSVNQPSCKRSMADVLYYIYIYRTQHGVFRLREIIQYDIYVCIRFTTACCSSPTTIYRRIASLAAPLSSALYRSFDDGNGENCCRRGRVRAAREAPRESTRRTRSYGDRRGSRRGRATAASAAAVLIFISKRTRDVRATYCVTVF